MSTDEERRAQARVRRARYLAKLTDEERRAQARVRSARHRAKLTVEERRAEAKKKRAVQRARYGEAEWRARAKERFAVHRAKFTDEEWRARDTQVAHRVQAAAPYAKRLLAKWIGCKCSDIPQELIEAKQQQIKLLRLIKERKNEVVD